MKVKSIMLGKGIRYARGNLEGNILSVGKKKYFVSTIFPREIRTVASFGLRRKIALYAVCMKGEPRTLAYMDSFDSDAFNAYLLEIMEQVESKDITPEKANELLWKWKGPDTGIESEPWLTRKFKQAPVTDEQLHLAITDSQRTKIMRGEPIPLWIIVVVAMAIAMVGLAAAIFGLTSQPPPPPAEPPTVVLDKIRMWLHG